MSMLISIASGSIAADVRYQVVGGTSVVYNAATYNAGTTFIGVTGVTAYTKTAGTEVVTKAAQLNSIALGLAQTTYTGLFADTAQLSGIATGAGAILYYFESYTEAEFEQTGEQKESPYMKIEISNNTDFDGIIYSGGWTDVMYIDTELDKPKYPTVLEGERDGDNNTNYLFTRFDKRIGFRLPVFEYTADVLSSLPLLKPAKLFVGSDEFCLMQQPETEFEWLEPYYAIATVEFSERYVVSRTNDINL